MGVEVVGRRIQEARRLRRLSQLQLAAKIGNYTRPMISMIERGRSGMSAENLLAAAKVLGVSTDYLYSLTDDPAPAAELLHQEADPELAWVGKYGVLGSAGPGAFVDSEHVVKQIGFRRDWLRKKGLNPAKCSVIDVHGDSMEPTLHHGAMILIDHQRARRLKNRIFAVRSDDGPLIKRLMHDNHHWLLVSDNEEYKPVKWPREAVVIGQVMWTGRTL